MEILNARYTAYGSILAFVGGNEMIIPAVGGNRHYDELVAQGITPEPYVEPAPTAEQVRAQRNQLLAVSDWTQVADAPVDQAAWAVYRQELRDITEQVGFPETIDWPVEP